MKEYCASGYGKSTVRFNGSTAGERWLATIRPRRCGLLWAVAVAILVVVGTPRETQAENVFWVNPGVGDWHDAANWDPRVPLGVSDKACIENGGTAQLNSTIVYADSPGTVYVGTVGTGTLEHFAGEWLRGAGLQIGKDAGSSGVYRIGGTARAYFGSITIASTIGNGLLEQTGGDLDCWQSYVYAGGRQVQSAGTSNVRDRLYFRGEYDLSGTGVLTCKQVELHGMFSQSGGHHATDAMTCESGTYLMQGGTYQAKRTVIGDIYNHGYSPRCQLSGGTMDVGNLAIRTRGYFAVSGGTLVVSDSIDPDSPMTFAAGSWSIDVRGGIGDFSNAAFDDVGQASLISSPGTLTLLPAGVDPGQFASCSPGGIVHVGGSTLTVPAGQTISGQGGISDRVTVYGRLIPASAYQSDPYIQASGGVEVHAGGEFNLGSGTLTVNEPTSGMDGGSLKARRFYVGNGAAGRFVQTGGSFDDGDSLSGGPEIFVGYDSGGDGYYELTDGTIRAEMLRVGTTPGVGHFRQSGGSVALGFTTGSTLSIGEGGVYEMQGGSLSSRYLYCGGLVTQTGGTIISNEAPMASRNETGAYELDGGTHQVATLWLGKYRNSRATYRVGGNGKLIAGKVWVGSEYGDGTGGQGRLEAAGGVISCQELIVGHGPQGVNELCISDPNASITVSKRLEVGASARFCAVAGVTIRMTGGTVANGSTNASALDGLSQLRIVMDGGVSSPTKYEVGGADLGAIADGFPRNFAMDALCLGGSQPGRVELIDAFDNQLDGLLGNEALYVRHLAIGAGSWLDLNGLNLYYGSAAIDPTAIIVLDGGSIRAVPEPGSLTLLVLGVIGVLLWRHVGRRGRFAR